MDLCNPDYRSMSIRQHAEQEFREFVKQTYEGLCDAELKMLSAKSSIIVFVQFDIGLVESRGDGWVHYFVNEVERTQTMSLWSNRWTGLGLSQTSVVQNSKQQCGMGWCYRQETRSSCLRTQPNTTKQAYNLRAL